MLQHLQTKESTIDNITGLYRQRGHKLIRMLVDGQLVELRQTAAAFDDKCIQLENLFAESAHTVKTVNKRMFSENKRHLRDWARRRKELEEATRMAREAAASF